eukprot:scaffold66889_cov27-Phaeocystis_antarctica.AAC.1
MVRVRFRVGFGGRLWLGLGLQGRVRRRGLAVAAGRSLAALAVLPGLRRLGRARFVDLSTGSWA